MRVASIKLTNFKRFSDLRISNIPKATKLVVVVGPNGCGKSSLFDAFLHWYRRATGFGINNDKAYYQKQPEAEFNWDRTVEVSLHDGAQPKKGALYVRTAYRNDPDFSVDGINRPANPAEELRIGRVIDNDQTVSQNYRRLIYDTMAGVYNEANDSKTVRDLRHELIGALRESMARVFGDLVINNVADPLGAGAFFFEKGTAKSYHYKNLSGGEKAAFDLLLDLHVKRRFFADAIYCIDELDAHLHTRVQGALIRELVRILPDTSQLWVSTHSLGVLRAAQDMMARDPSSVSLIDFEGVDPDTPHELAPSNLNRVTWEKLLSIALDDLSQRLAPRIAILCEGSSVGNRRKDFDAEIYNRILGTHHPEVVFISGGSSGEVKAMGVMVRDVLGRVLPQTQFWSLLDRDDKSNGEVEELERNRSIVLPLRNLESFLFADDVMQALLAREQKPEQTAAVTEVKRKALENSVLRGNRPDDLKSAAGEIYTELKKLLGLKRCGNDTDAFMRDTLAPLIQPPMPAYQALSAAIIDKVL